MDRRIIEIGSSAVFVFVATYLINTLRSPLWDLISQRVSIHVGELILIPILVGLCIFSAAAFSFYVNIHVLNLALGGTVIYVLWLLYIESVTGPFDSPAHIYLGIFYLAGFSVGALLANWSQGRILSDNKI
jgi:hypothetical protein